ncbi:RNA polymerase subunit RPABC4/transcription elongation factor Spt4 [Jeotgalibacillus terrae]|nr:RNA polymerase subunit RPABC4/transcription elongation factor Spt4 [Jeotgalibacillus terrae]
MDQCVLCGDFVPQGEDVCPICAKVHHEIIDEKEPII